MLVLGQLDSSWVGRLDVPGWIPRSIVAAPCKFPPVDHDGGMLFSHLGESTPTSRLPRRQAWNEGWSFSPLVKRFRWNRRHILVEIPSQPILPCTLVWSNQTSLLLYGPTYTEEYVDSLVVQPSLSLVLPNGVHFWLHQKMPCGRIEGWRCFFVWRWFADVGVVTIFGNGMKIIWNGRNWEGAMWWLYERGDGHHRN